MRQLLKTVTTTMEEARRALDISRDEYALCSYVLYRQASSRATVPGWCCDPKDSVADFVGVSRPGLYKMIDRMEAKGLMETNPANGVIRTTAVFMDAENGCKQSLHFEKTDRKQSLHSTVNKVYTPGAKSVNKVTPIYRNKEDNISKSKYDIVADAPTENQTVFSVEIFEPSKKEILTLETEKKYGFKADRLTKRQAYLARNEWMKDMKKSDDMNTVMDAWLYNIARQMGKWTGGIEDLNDQLSLIEKDEADFSFEDLLIDKKIMQGGLNYLIDLYLSQDLQALDDFFNHSTESKKDEWLIKRNIKMAHRMDSLLRFRTHFFAIGAAHLPGDSGVIKLLLKKGLITPQEAQALSQP